MVDAVSMQKRMNELQDSDVIANLFSKVVSGGKPGYKTIIEKNKPVKKCKTCGKVLEGTEKFCSECGTKVDN